MLLFNFMLFHELFTFTVETFPEMIDSFIVYWYNITV